MVALIRYFAVAGISATATPTMIVAMPAKALDVTVS
jgi:hypothetical protein